LRRREEEEAASDGGGGRGFKGRLSETWQWDATTKARNGLGPASKVTLARWTAAPADRPLKMNGQLFLMVDGEAVAVAVIIAAIIFCFYFCFYFDRPILL
jgi:hypothetical protein